MRQVLSDCLVFVWNERALTRINGQYQTGWVLRAVPKTAQLLTCKEVGYRCNVSRIQVLGVN